MSTRIKEGWDRYRKAVIPEDAPSMQFLECRRAFYAGAFEIITTNVELGEMKEEEAIKILEGLLLEAIEFRKKVERGEA
jgi:hypothetical protein